MEDNERSKKPNTESLRVPSPSSVSSIHSIRPLEWDSGADIGYECKSQTDLSTVERMALVSRTANLLETCKSYDIMDKASHTFYKFDVPVAHSSPFMRATNINDLKLISSYPKSEQVDSNFPRPLVDYSMSSDYSLEEKEIILNTLRGSDSGSLKCSRKSNSLRKNKLSNISLGSSRSLDDLRCSSNSSKTKKCSAARSYSSCNMIHSLNRKVSNEKNPSSSSAVTVVSRLETDGIERKYSNKSVQVDEALLGVKFITDEFVLPLSSTSLPNKSDIAFLRSLYHKSGRSDRSHGSNTVEEDQQIHFLSSNRDKSDVDSGSQKTEGGSGSCRSNVESLDGGSFEYVSGSVFNEDRLKLNSCSEETKSSSSEVNTLCSEVVDGVDLITKYVDNLQVNNKRKIIKKMAQFLINNLANEENKRKYSKEASIQCKLRESISSSLFVNSSPDMAIRNQLSLATSNMKNELVSGNGNSEVSKVQSENSGLVESSSQKHSNLEFSEPSSSSTSIKKHDFGSTSLQHKVSTSCYSFDSDTNLSSSQMEKATSNAAKIHSLKQYLAKERETQLLWIKSGISHLNNLRRLYESQRSLKRDLNCLSSSTETRSNRLRTESHSHIVNQEANKIREIPKTPKKNRYKYTSSESNSFQKNTVSLPKKITTKSRTRANILKLKNEDESNKHYSDTETKNCTCKCACCGVHKLVTMENKENFAENSNISIRSVRQNLGKKCEPCVTYKPAISYTVLFDKNPTVLMSQNFKYKEQTVKKSVSKTYLQKCRMRKTALTTDLECLPNRPNLHPLKEYLLQNRPEYIHRAELRRQCLLEIARLRELRDKSRNELVSMMQKSNESRLQTDNIPPQPLSVVRIFNDKSIRKQTAKKYQQLPEIQTKKIETKRKDSYRRNQIMAKVFTKKLQKKVLKGQVNIANSVNVISM